MSLQRVRSCKVDTDMSRYNYPGVTNNLVVSIDTYAKLAAHPKIVGCKM